MSTAQIADTGTWGVMFRTSSNQFAEVAFSSDVIAEFNSTHAASWTTESLAANLVNSLVYFDENGISGASAATAYPYWSFDQTGHVDGVIPDGTSATLDIATPSGSNTGIYGAFEHYVTYGGSAPSGDWAPITGTVMGDILSDTAMGFDPRKFHSTLGLQMSSVKSFIQGWEGDDLILGGNGQDILYGRCGDDKLFAFQTTGTASADVEVLYGGLGDDTLYSGRTHAIFPGGEDSLTEAEDGNDTASFTISVNTIVADLSTGTAYDVPNGTGSVSGNIDFFTCELISIENLTGSQYADTLTGNGGENVFTWSGGGDDINGGDGVGNYSLSLDRFSDAFVADHAAVLAATSDGSGLTATIGGATDTLAAGTGNDRLLGVDGDDVLTGNARTDRFFGGDGLDTIDYADNGSAGVSVDLASGVFLDTFGGTDIVDQGSIELCSSTSADDMLVGDAANGTSSHTAARFTGEGGDDTIVGNGLRQARHFGGDGDDTMLGLGASDLMDGEDGAVLLYGHSEADTLPGPAARTISTAERAPMSSWARRAATGSAAVQEKIPSTPAAEHGTCSGAAAARTRSSSATASATGSATP